MMKNGPRILFVDIETAPDVVWTWGVYQQNAIAVKEHWFVLSVAWKWRGDKKVTVRGLPDYPHYKKGSSTERALLQDVHGLLSDADIVVAHNGADFDCRKLNARFIFHGMKPPAPYKVVDTKRDLAHVAAFSSNRLNWLSKQLGIGKKTMEHQDWKMWEGCINGEKRAWREMKRYNKHDVKLLEELYEIVAPWIRQPNAVMWGQQCTNPACKGKRLQSRGFTRNKTHAYQRFQCQDCGSWSRAVRSEKELRAATTPV